MTPIAALLNEVQIPVEDLSHYQAYLEGFLVVPDSPRGIVVFAHGAGSSRLSPRNGAVAASLRREGSLGTLLFDLLTVEEDVDYRVRFDIGLLTERLLTATDWLATQAGYGGTPIGYFGASTGAAAALRAAHQRPDLVRTVVSRGGRPDLATEVLPDVKAPTLLIVGGHDPEVIDLNRAALERLGGEKALAIVPGATHLFEEPGALEEVSALAGDWFNRYLR